MRIELSNVSKSFGATRVIRELSCEIQPNEFFFLLGPSGCGKTTLLRMLAGFVTPDSGEIRFDGQSVADLPPEARKTPMVFQSYALWPHLTVFENVAYGLRVQKLSQERIQQSVREALEITRMSDYAARSPQQLSGGQQQRVAIARALAVNPKVLLFDEPLSNLDAKLREEMRQELIEIHRQKPFTGIYVTHDQEEAMMMATRLAVLDQGVLQQVGSPHEVYTSPKNRFVADFLGAMNWLPAEVQNQEGQQLQLKTSLGEWSATGKAGVSDRVLLGFRPNAASLGAEASAAPFRISCEVVDVQYVGAFQRLLLKPKSDPRLKFQLVDTHTHTLHKVGEVLEIGLRSENLTVVKD
jgi:iron(III) transport system ATP-binding protein